MLDRFLQAVPPRQVDGTIRGLLAPHAGLQYSGPVAAHAFALVKGWRLIKVVIVGPMHHPMPGHITDNCHTAYETPLGTRSG